jgi:hypothetical protein
MKLFTDGASNAKTSKSEKSGKGYATLLLHLAPAKESGYEVCASRSAGCTMACLYTAGRGRFDATKNARIRRTKMWFEQKTEFKAQIIKELTAFVKKCLKNDVYPAVRMNGTSDILWENQFPEIFAMFPTIQFYDYTKHYKRCLASYKLPSNYHLTFSRSEDNDEKVEAVLKAGRFNVAVVFDSKNPPSTWNDFPTYSADDDDLRFLDPKGGHVGTLYAKGDGKKDESGFVILT